MTQADKDLLLKDLCGRIMYDVKCSVYEDTSVHTLSGVLPNYVYKELYFRELDWKECDGFADVQYCKPYLFPLSSMSDEQLPYYITTLKYSKETRGMVETPNSFDWFNKNHFDYRGLIDKGLAIDATELNVY